MAIPAKVCQQSHESRLMQHFLALHDIDAFGLRAEIFRSVCAAAVEVIDGCRVKLA